MPNAYTEHNGLILSEKQVVKLIRESLIRVLVNKDLHMSDADIQTTLFKLKENINDIAKRTNIEKTYPLTDPFYIRVPKDNTAAIIVDFDGLDNANRSISFGLKIPASFLTNGLNKPHVIYASEYSMNTVKNIKYGKDLEKSPTNNILALSVPGIINGTVSVRSTNWEVKKYEANDDINPITVMPIPETDMSLAPDTNIPTIPDIDNIVRSKSGIKWLETVTLSEYTKLEMMDQITDEVAYLVRKGQANEGVELTFNTVEEAKAGIEALRKKMPDQIRNTTIKFADTVTDISHLFDGYEGADTPRAIVGENIRIAHHLFANSKIANVSLELFSSLNNLQDLDYAFYNTPLRDVPPVGLIKRNTQLATARYMFGKTGVTKDPEYHMYTNAALNGYLYKETEDPIAPIPYQPYSKDRAYPATYDPKNWVFRNVEQFRRYYPNYFKGHTDADIPDIKDLSDITITILEGNIDRMFREQDQIKKLPKMVIAPRATSAIEFAKNISTLQYTDALPNIFAKCPRLRNITSAFENTGITKGFEFVGATDTINNYSKVFYNCTHIENGPLMPTPWKWDGLDGYPDDIVGNDAYKGIPNLPDWFPVPWGGPGTAQDPHPNNVARSVTPVITECFVGDTYFVTSIKNISAGDLVEVALVDGDNRFNVKGDVIRFYNVVDNAPILAGIGSIDYDDRHSVLRNTDCVRIRWKNNKNALAWSEYAYQVPMIRTTALTPIEPKISPIGFVTDGEV